MLFLLDCNPGETPAVADTTMPTAKLTARNVGTLPAPAAGRVEYRDESLPGFYLRVTASGVRTYGAWCRIRRRGKRASFGRHPVVALADARIKARAFLRSAADGLDSTRERRIPDFATILNAYVEARTGTIANSTRIEYWNTRLAMAGARWAMRSRSRSMSSALTWPAGILARGPV